MINLSGVMSTLDQLGTDFWRLAGGGGAPRRWARMRERISALVPFTGKLYQAHIAFRAVTGQYQQSNSSAFRLASASGRMRSVGVTAREVGGT